MNSKDLLCAIAETNDEYLYESQRFNAVAGIIKLDRQKQRRKITAYGIALVLCVAAFAVWKQTPLFERLRVPNGTTGNAPENSDTSPLLPGYAVPDTRQLENTEIVPENTEIAPEKPETGTNDPVSGPGTTVTPPVTEPPVSRPAEQPSRPADVDGPDIATTEQISEPYTGNSAPGGANAVYSQINVDYNGAKEKFAHPIVPCTDGAFTGYKAGIVSRSGNINERGAFCISVIYEFTNGTISLTDQDRLNAGTGAEGEACEYRGRVFYVAPDYYGRLHIWYLPTQEQGIAYQAHFEQSADRYAVMDLILALEI